MGIEINNKMKVKKDVIRPIVPQETRVTMLTKKTVIRFYEWRAK